LECGCLLGPLVKSCVYSRCPILIFSQPKNLTISKIQELDRRLVVPIKSSKYFARCLSAYQEEQRGTDFGGPSFAPELRFVIIFPHPNTSGTAGLNPYENNPNETCGSFMEGFSSQEACAPRASIALFLHATINVQCSWVPNILPKLKVSILNIVLNI